MKADVVVIGGGPNGLAAAALLAKAGKKPLVLERREIVGGAAVTEEFHPGFRASTVAHTAGPLRASLEGALQLQKHGLEWIRPEPRVLAPHADGRALLLYGDPARTTQELARFSAKDGARYAAFHASMGRIAAVLGKLLELTPPDVERPDLRDLFPLAGFGWALRRLGRRDGQDLLRWGPMAVADFAQEWFETPLMAAVVAARGIQGMLAGPWSAGTTANLLLQAASGDGNGAGATVLVKGGLGALTEALASAARAAGATIRTGAPVERLLQKDGRVVGVVLAGGEEIETRAVASAVDPQQTLLRLLDPVALDPDDVQCIRNFRTAGMASKLNLALSGLPRFKGAADEAALRGRIHIGADIDTLERAFDDAKYGGISRRPYLDVTIPSLTDPTLAPAGQHVMSIYAQYTPYKLKTGSWPERSKDVVASVLATLEEYAPGIGTLVVGRQVLTPADFEATYGITGGHPSHGEPALDQLFLARPFLGFGRYRTPIRGLYLCSAGTHPGGGVTSAPGANAAREILRDLS